MSSEDPRTTMQRRSPPAGATAMVRTGFYSGLEVSIDRERIVIGRGRNADLALAEATLSRAHAAVGYHENGFYVEDLGSTNGTLVNGARIRKQSLKNDDEIRMGKLVIQVSLPE